MDELDQHPEWFGQQVAPLVRKGAGIKAVRLLRAQDEAQTVVEAIDRRFDEGAWALLLPTTIMPAAPIEKLGSQLDMLALTAPFSLGGWPSLSVPMGLVEGLPVGMQIVAPRGQDKRLCAIASAVEQGRPWPAHAPGFR